MVHTLIHLINILFIIKNIHFILLTYIFKCAIFHLQYLSVKWSPQTLWPRNPQASGLSRGYPLNLDSLLVLDINHVCPLLLIFCSFYPNTQRCLQLKNTALEEPKLNLLYVLGKICTPNDQYFRQYPCKHTWYYCSTLDKIDIMW